MAKILAVGIATLDIINSVSHYPVEDEEMRALSQRISRGGNATNTLQILVYLGHEAYWAGVLAEDADAAIIQHSLDECGVHMLGCRSVAGGRTPVSYITHNVKNGSRTIVHYRDLPEFSYDDFRSLPLDGFEWVHFEGRNPVETLRMMQQLKNGSDVPISLEIEKSRPGLDELTVYADVILFSRAYATGQGFHSAEQFLEQQHGYHPGKTLVCAWGAQGAYGIETEGVIRYSPAFPPEKMVDTLGAGDTFNAAMIDALIQNMSLEDSLYQACRLAGRKCGVSGLDL